MQTPKMMENGQRILISHCAAVLRQSVGLIEKMSDAIYAYGGRSSVGAHFRHNLEFAQSFLRGLETGRLDYAARERNARLETDRFYAAGEFRAVAAALENLANDELNGTLLVRSETVSDLWCVSSPARELEFLQSHTIHHYALIKMKLATLSFEVSKDFGVAPSTLNFRQSRTA